MSDEKITSAPPEYDMEAALLPEPADASGGSGDRAGEMSRIEYLRRETEAVKRREEGEAKLGARSAVESAIRSATALKAKIVGLETIQRDGQQAVCLAALIGPNIKALIPYMETYSRPPINVSDLDLNDRKDMNLFVRRQQQAMSKLLGLEVPVVVSQVLEDGPITTVLASRKAALEFLQQRAFGSARPRFREGDIYSAEVVSSAPHNVVLCLAGFDVVVRHYQLTLRYIKDLSAVYKPGDRVDVKLAKVVRDDSGKVVTLELDPIAAEIRESSARAELVRPGTIAKATITAVRRGRSGATVIMAWLNDYDIPCRITYASETYLGRALIAGQECRVITGQRATSTGMVTARIQYTSGASGIYASL